MKVKQVIGCGDFSGLLSQWDPERDTYLVACPSFKAMKEDEKKNMRKG
jgi:hypothetical protein